MILGSDSTSCGLPRCSDPLRCSSASRLRWASSGLSERAEMYRNCSSKLLSSSIFQNVAQMAACFVVCHGEMHAMHEMHGDHSLVEFEARSKSSNKIGNSYDMDRDSRDTDRSTYRSGYSRDTIECLCLFASVCLPLLCRVL